MDKEMLLLKFWRFIFNVLQVPSQKSGLSGCVGLGIVTILVSNSWCKRLILKLCMEEASTTNWLCSKDCEVVSHWTWVDFQGLNPQRSSTMYCTSLSLNEKVVQFHTY